MTHSIFQECWDLYQTLGTSVKVWFWGSTTVIYIYIYIYTCVCVCVYVYTCIYAYTCIYTHVCIYVYTCMYICIRHICVYICLIHSSNFYISHTENGFLCVYSCCVFVRYFIFVSQKFLLLYVFFSLFSLYFWCSMNL